MQLIFSLMIGFDPRVAPYTEYTDTSAFLKSVYLNMKDLLGNLYEAWKCCGAKNSLGGCELYNDIDE